MNLLSGIPRQFSAWFSQGTWVHPDLRLPVARFALICFALISPILQLEPPVYIRIYPSPSSDTCYYQVEVYNLNLWLSGYWLPSTHASQ